MNPEQVRLAWPLKQYLLVLGQPAEQFVLQSIQVFPIHNVVSNVSICCVVNNTYPNVVRVCENPFHNIDVVVLLVVVDEECAAVVVLQIEFFSCVPLSLQYLYCSRSFSSAQVCLVHMTG